MEAFYSSELVVGVIIQSKGSELLLYFTRAVHRSEGESEGRADLLLPAGDKERVQGMLMLHQCKMVDNDFIV